jgi:hypothetical protein
MRNVKERGKEPTNGQGILFPSNQFNPMGIEGEPDPLDLETVMKLLKDQGVVVTSDQGQLILELLHQLSNIIISQFLQNEQDS